MRLKKLIIQGFKSFKNRTIINFDCGITGIVGPNGCGKSNIVDALYWVMGEQSAKHLRGSTMKDLIFAGSSKYNPSSFAEASLVLENTSQKYIHIGRKISSPKEIELTRKLYKNGETEYRINGEMARLKDIQEVFMDTGAGVKSYSIIAQGEVNRIVQSKPIERRGMIEEVAGITKFKLRKKESIRKIEQTKENLYRLDNLTVEIEKNLKSLEKQSEKASKGKSLKEKIQRTDLLVNSHKIFDFLKKIKEGRNNLNEKRIALENLIIEKETLEISLEKERYTREEKNEEIEMLQEKRNESSNQLSMQEERLNSSYDSLQEKKRQVEIRQEEINNIVRELDERNEKIESLFILKNNQIERNDELFEKEQKSDKLKWFKAKLKESENILLEKRKRIISLKEEINLTNQKEFQNNSLLEKYALFLQDISIEMEGFEKEYSGSSCELTRLKLECKNTYELLNKIETSEKISKESLEKILEKERKLEEELRIKIRSQISIDGRLASLKELTLIPKGLKQGTSSFLKEDKSDLYSLFGSVIKCEEKYTKAVTALLGDFFKTLTVSSCEMKELKEWMAAKSNLALDVLIGDSERKIIGEELKEELKLKLDTEVFSLIDIVEIPQKYKSNLLPYLSGFFIVPSLSFDQIRSISSEIDFIGISDIEGQVILKNQKKALFLSQKGKIQKAENFIDYNNEINKLKLDLKEINESLTANEEQLSLHKNQIELERSEHKRLEDEFIKSKTDYTCKNSTLNLNMERIKSGEVRVEVLKKRKVETSKLRLESLEKEENLILSKKKYTRLILREEKELENREEEYQKLKNDYEIEKEDFLKREIETKSYTDKIESLDFQIEDMKFQIEKHSIRIESNNNLISDFEEEISSIDNEVEDLESSNSEIAIDLTEQEKKLSLKKSEFSRIHTEMQEREDKVKKLLKEISHIDKEVMSKNTLLERALNNEEEVTRNIFEKYHIDLREVIGNILEYEEEDYNQLNSLNEIYYMEGEDGLIEIKKNEYKFSKRYGQDLNDQSVKLKSFKLEYSKLGEINWQAIEDFEKQKLRYDFLRLQEKELKKSLTDLESAIAYIDEKSRERFKIAFEEVDERFRKIFPVIFGGGEALLKIVGDIEDPECGVDIVARPLGKKMQNINLMSGGEKALTAVSLIFSIFLVRPSPFCFLDEVDAALDDANVGRFNELLGEMSKDSQFIVITHNKKTMELNDNLYGVTMQDPGVSTAVSVQLH